MKKLKDMTNEELWQLFPIELKHHRDDYSACYEQMKSQLLTSLKDDVYRINHIGSTAVKGLISKPIVDILLEVDIKANVNDIIKIIKKDGWILMSLQKEPYYQVSFNKGYTKKGFAERVYHLHLRYFDDWGELYFRDYLLENKKVAYEYGKLKTHLISIYRNNRDGYTEAKSEFVNEYT